MGVLLRFLLTFAVIFGLFVAFGAGIALAKHLFGAEGIILFVLAAAAALFAAFITLAFYANRD